MKDLAERQNQFLEKFTKSKQEGIPIMNVTKKQIISKALSVKNAKPILQNNNCFNWYRYQEGDKIHYDKESILDQCESLMLAGKCFINCGDVKFSFSNVGDPYDEFDKINAKIAQMRHPMCERVIEGLSEPQRSRLFNDELRTTINLLKQTGGEKD